jgi:hypothetical protein
MLMSMIGEWLGVKYYYSGIHTNPGFTDTFALLSDPTTDLCDPGACPTGLSAAQTDAYNSMDAERLQIEADWPATF